MEYAEEDYLKLSGIQHFVFCRRQWALIHLEQQWAENYRTTDGNIMHRNVHDSEYNESRGDIIITRGMAVASAVLGISGECDVVEFHWDPAGVSLNGRDGRYRVVPVEYKRGKPKGNDSDIMQLAAQAVCLEEMLCCEIPEGFLFYGETRRRQRVEFTPELRRRLIGITEEMHELIRRGHTPADKRSRSCNACSLKELCVPALEKRSASSYIKEMTGGDGR